MRLVRFTKMHGLGNDYLYVDCFRQALSLPPQELARLLSPRRFAVGADGVILILPSSSADCRMEVYNADGSRAEMCGNGIRCVGKYVFDSHIARKPVIHVETDAGVKELKLHIEDGLVSEVTVDMGPPNLVPSEIPINVNESSVIDMPLSVGDRQYRVTCVSMGNPHCVVFVDDPDALTLEQIGPLFEHHPVFPKRVNTEFVQALGRNRLRVRVWERGSGETLACGTGACAALVAAVLQKRSERDATVELRGGALGIRWSEADGHVYMTGPAVKVYDGEVDIDEFPKQQLSSARGASWK